MEPLTKTQRLLAVLGVLCALAFALWAINDHNIRTAEVERQATAQQSAEFERWHDEMRAEWDALEYGELVEAELEEDNHMANIIVEDAGTVAADGTYIETGTHAGKPLYLQDGGSYEIFWEAPTWMIGIRGTDYLYFVESATDEPPSGAVWTTYEGDEPAPAVNGAPDVTAPVIAAAAITSVGNILAISWTEADSPPVVGSSGLSLDNLTHGAATLSNVVTTGTGTTADISRIIYEDEAPTLSYTPGDFADSATTPNPVEAFSGVIVINDSLWELMPSSSSSMLMVF